MSEETIWIYSQSELDAAIAAEREACAKIAADIALDRGEEEIGEEIAAAIRARGEK